MNTADITALALRIGLEGDELRAWVEEREARAREDRAAELEARIEEEELERQQRELEVAKQKTLQLQLKLAEVEKLRFVRENRHATNSMSSSEQAAEGCYKGSTFFGKISNSLVGGGGGRERWQDSSLEPGVQAKYHAEVGGASRASSGELDEAVGSFAGVEQESSSWDDLNFGAYGGPSTVVKEERVPQGCSDKRAWAVSMRDNEEYPLADSKVIVTSYSCGPLDAASCDMGSVAEDQLDGSHKNVMVTSDSGEDGDVSCGTQAVSQDSERHSEEFTDAIGCFESKGDEPPMEKGFGSYERIGEVHEEVTVPLDDHGGCRAASEREIGTIKCLSPVGDTCGAVMVECHADDLVVREGSSQADANGVYRSGEENSTRVLLLDFSVEQNEVMVPYVGVPEVDVGFKAREFLRNITDVNESSVASSDAETFADRTMQNTGMKEGAVRRMHDGCTWQHLCTNCWFGALRSAISPIVLVCSYRQASDAERFKAFRTVSSAKQVKTSIRLVWDAIT